ncbi:hypothetical protein AB835_08645 [Candidatus Endobugula sertula]|uniref:Acylneuraminate cytidylyltransferase n=1 Tax=Candidatus Endobugula sertula TaxID=62101 RepID=A0A1D2QPJ8_9GAMM|nr:hypothetical protein AB835_08645 [Candidatus Endobugula sertula]
MYKKLKILGVVPARGGSKGVPHKNIRSMAGEPLIGHTLRNAKRVDLFDRLIVSTDDDEISHVASSYDTDVIIRPPELAADTASTEVALLHVLETLEQKELELFDIIVVLEPTSPLRSIATIVGAIQYCIDNAYDSVLAVKPTKENIGHIKNGIFRPIVADAPRRRQDRNPLYIESSTIYVCQVSYLQRTGTLVTDNWGAFVVPEEEAMDINTEDDFMRVETVFNRNK